MGSNVKKNKCPPQLNKFMHPRNPYKKFPSFKELATLYPEFRTHCTYDIAGKVFLNFKNVDALKALTTCLLHKDFNLKVTIPDNRLVPTLPLRLNYLLWIEDLLTRVYPKSSKADNTNPVIGMDIGTGAACIYPLLGLKKLGWNFISTETDGVSYESAKENIERNELQESILLLQNSSMFEVLDEQNVVEFLSRKVKFENTENVFDGESQSDYLVDFTMCNPPFFASDDEMDTNHNSRKETRCQPNSVSTGSSHEKVIDGGEISFITKMIEMSLRFKDKIRIFSTLIGKRSDVKTVVKLIKERAGEDGAVNVCDTEFCQGRTMRWGVSWTFDPTVHLDQITSKKKRLSQKPLVLNVPRSMMTSYNVQNVWSRVLVWLKDIKIKPQIFKENNYYVGATIRTYKATWQNQRQKKRQKKLPSNELSPDSSSDPTSSKTISSASPMKNEGEEDEEQLGINQPKRKMEDEEMDNLTKKFKQNPAFFGISNPNNCDSTNDENGGASDRTSSHIDALKGTEIDGPVETPANKKVPDCLLRCNIHLKQTNAVINIEMNYIDGTGKKEAMNQLLQYIKNRLANQ